VPAAIVNLDRLILHHHLVSRVIPIADIYSFPTTILTESRHFILCLSKGNETVRHLRVA
jgi:hypothetical protein